MNLLSWLGQTAFEWTWKTSFYATLLIVLVFVLQMSLAKWLTPRLRYTLSLLVLIRLLLPITPSSVLSFENLFPPAARLSSPVVILPNSNQPARDVTMVQQPNVTSRLTPAAVKPIRVPVSGTLGIVWASGCLGLLLLAGWRLGKWHALLREGHLISDPRLLDLLNNARQAMQIRSPVELVAVARLGSPAVFGLFRVRLLLPDTALRQLNGEELRMIFLHEMAHVRRKDILLNYLLMGVQFLHWFNPLVWLALHRLRADRELVCDAMVMQKVKPEERLGYGKVLLKLMDGFSAGSPVFSGAVPVISSREEIKRRISMIKNHRTASNTVCAMTALLILVLAFGSFTHAYGHFNKETKTAIANLKAGLQNEDQQARRNAMMNFWTSPITVTEAENPALTEALPILLQAMTDQDRTVRSDAVFALRKIRSSDQQVTKALGHLVRVETDLNTAVTAATALKETGPSAAPAVPDLIQVLENRNDDGTFISATEGPVEPNLALGTALRRAVIEALGNIGAPAQDAVPILRGKLKDTGIFSLGNRVFSAEALWQITGKTDEALPVLISALEKDNSFWAADILGMMGAAAKPAIPTLRSALQSPNSDTRLRSAVALDNITSELAHHQVYVLPTNGVVLVSTSASLLTISANGLGTNAVALNTNQSRNLDGGLSLCFTGDAKKLIMRVSVGWRITDASAFAKSFPGASITLAQGQLKNMVRRAEVLVIGVHNLSELVNPDGSAAKNEKLEREIQNAIETRLDKNSGITIESLVISSVKQD